MARRILTRTRTSTTAEGDPAAEEEAAAAEEEEEAAAEGEVDEPRVARTLRAPRTPRVGLSEGDSSASSGTRREESRTSGRQRYHSAANARTVYTEPDMTAALLSLPLVVF